MPDLFTHASIGLFARSRAPRSPLVWFVIGSCLPDLASRLPGLGLAALAWLLDLQFPLPVLEATGLCHNPIPYLVLCLLVAMCLPAALRSTALVNLAAGGLLHLAIDTTQTHLNGGYYLLYPFTLRRFELGWIESDASLSVMPYLVTGALGVLGWRLWRVSRSGRSRGADPGADSSA